jgi:hypothetical protein
MSDTIVYEQDDVKAVFVEQDDETLVVDFNVRLHHGRSDFSVYSTNPRPAWNEEDPHNQMAVQLFLALFVSGAANGVEEVKMKPYRLIIKHSRAISALSIVPSIEDAVANFIKSR